MGAMDQHARLIGPVVFFTGAGASVGAGLPTYRGQGGLYDGTGVEPPNAADLEPDRLPGLWARFAPRLRAREASGPAPAHHAIAALERQAPGEVVVVTQNVDGLHQAAGSTRVIELHGSLGTMRCFGAGHSLAVVDARWGDDGVPQCPECGEPCRPNVVLFGEMLPRAAWEAGGEAIRDAATVVAVGTSASVQPAASLISAAATAHSVRIWVNPRDEPPDGRWQWLAGTADEELARLAW